MKRIFRVLMFSLLAMFVLTGCYFQQQVESNQVGLKLDDGVSITSVVGPGRYDSGGFYSELRTADVSNKTVEWFDASLLTKDNQPIGLKLAITYARKSDSESIKGMFQKYNHELFDDSALQTLVFSRVPDIAKAVTIKYTLAEMLGRDTLAADIRDGLRTELDTVFVDLISVQITDIAPDEGYISKLKEKSQAIVDREVAMERAKTAEQTLAQTKAETEIKLELARRENLVNQELAKVYAANPEFFILKKLELMEKIIGPNDKVIFVPAGADLDFLYGQNGTQQVVPVDSGE